MQSQRLAGFRPHALHGPDRHWPETNCYVDLWIEVLADRGFEPEAMLGFTVRQDFEGDQFTFFKVPLEDLEKLYGVTVQELSIFDDLQGHLVEQIARGRLPLVEVDGLYLPDTDGVTYRVAHAKTTIAPVLIDPESRRMEYFHNAGFFSLRGEDYDGVFRMLPHLREQRDILFPYTEFAKFGASPSAGERTEIALRLLKYHLDFVPPENPVIAFQQAFPAQAARLLGRETEFFHAYAFNTLRQLGANFELLGAHLSWLGRGGAMDFDEEIEACAAIAGGAKAFQFQLARGVARRRTEGLEAQLTPLAEAWRVIFDDLNAKLG